MLAALMMTGLGFAMWKPISCFFSLPIRLVALCEFREKVDNR